MEQELKKKRKPNFTHEEVETLVVNYSKHSVPLQSKFGATMNKKKKDLLWEKITNAVNAVGCTVRTTDEVKAKWKEHKKNSKAKVVQHRKEVSKTGGGPPPKDLDTLDEITAAIIGETSIVGIPGGGMEIGGVEEGNLEIVVEEEDGDNSPLGQHSVEATAENEQGFENPFFAGHWQDRCIGSTDAETQTVMSGNDAMAALLAQGERQIAIQQRLAEAIERLAERSTRD